jgi:hypothetical protein
VLHELRFQCQGCGHPGQQAVHAKRAADGRQIGCVNTRYGRPDRSSFPTACQISGGCELRS